MKKGIKYFGILLGMMLIFTVISRSADSILVAQVMVESPSSKKIEQIVEMTGTVETNVEVPVMSEAGILVNSVYVQTGENVEEGQILADFSMEQLKEQIAAMENEIQVLELQRKAEESASTTQKTEQNRNYDRAKSDYEELLAEKEQRITAAKKEEQTAGDALNSFLAQETNGGYGELTQEERETKKQELLAELLEKQTQTKTIEEELNARLKEAQRAVEDATQPEAEDYGAQIASISIDEKKQQLEKLKDIHEAGGVVTAPQKGNITGVFLASGQKTTDTAAFSMAATGEGVRICAQLEEAQREYISIGDAAEVRKGSVKYDSFVVQSMQAKEDGGYKVVLETESNEVDFVMGETVTVQVVKQSELYHTAVSMTAIHKDSDGDYVYVLDEKQTVLGTERLARKVAVEIIENNRNYAALKEGSLGNDDRIIVDSDKYINAGDKVRLQEP